MCPQVIPQGDGYWCEHDSRSYESMERRYVLRVQAADFTGEHYLALFNDQVRRGCAFTQKVLLRLIKSARLARYSASFLVCMPLCHGSYAKLFVVRSRASQLLEPAVSILAAASTLLL